MTYSLTPPPPPQFCKILYIAPLIVTTRVGQETVMHGTGPGRPRVAL